MRVAICIFAKLRHMLRRGANAESDNQRGKQMGCGDDVQPAGVLMAARLDSVCRFICERGEWKVTNLQLQKVLYLAQMVHMGQNEGQRLADANFEAWDYGPVEPTVYRKVRMFGSSPIQDVFTESRKFKDGDARRAVLEQVCDDLLPRRAGELVEITHWKDGAWARHYEAGTRGRPIPDADIVAEYHDRIRGGRLKVA